VFKINIKEYLKILELFASNKSNSTSQCFQDLFVLYFSKFKSDGYFVDIGASNGVTFSNSFILERKGWKGIVSEPENTWHKKLNQRNCTKDYRVIYDQSDLDVSFSHVENDPMLSGITEHFAEDGNQKFRKNFVTKKYKTVSLNDLLIEHKAPKEIDYISIDTEGSENKILKSFNFDNFKVQIFTIEHNFVNEKRENVAKIMKENGYIGIFDHISKHDDWFLRRENEVLKNITV